MILNNIFIKIKLPNEVDVDHEDPCLTIQENQNENSSSYGLEKRHREELKVDELLNFYTASNL